MLLLVCTRAENSPNPYPGGMAPAPSSRNLSCPILMDADSLEMAKIDLWCPANDVHLQDLLKETAEMSDLQNDGIFGFRSLAIKGSHWCTGRGKTILLLLVLPPLHLSEKMGHFVLFQKQNCKKSFFFFFPCLILDSWVLWNAGLLTESTSFLYSLHLQLLWFLMQAENPCSLSPPQKKN